MIHFAIARYNKKHNAVREKRIRGKSFNYYGDKAHNYLLKNVGHPIYAYTDNPDSPIPWIVTTSAYHDEYAKIND